MLKELNAKATMLYGEDDRIVAYLTGQMSDEEGKLFLKELEDNADMKEKAIIIARLVKGLKEVGREKDRDILDVLLASDKLDVENALMESLRIRAHTESHDCQFATCQSSLTSIAKVEGDKLAIPKRKQPVNKWLAIAASLVIIIWFGVEFSMYNTTTSLAEQYGNEFTSSVVTRGAVSQSGASRKLEKLFCDVKKNNNIDNAIHELTLCWELSTMETYNDYTDYSAEIGWNLAIAHLKDNDKSDARKVLKRLVETSESGTAINQKAKELLRKL